MEVIADKPENRLAYECGWFSRRVVVVLVGECEGNGAASRAGGWGLAFIVGQSLLRFHNQRVRRLGPIW